MCSLQPAERGPSKGGGKVTLQKSSIGQELIWKEKGIEEKRTGKREDKVTELQNATTVYGLLCQRQFINKSSLYHSRKCYLKNSNISTDDPYISTTCSMNIQTYNSTEWMVVMIGHQSSGQCIRDAGAQCTAHNYIAASHSHVIAVCNLSCWLLISKVNGEAGGHMRSSLNNLCNSCLMTVSLLEFLLLSNEST